ncbi:SH3 domain-containing protein [Entamoeba marina]
MFTSFPFIKIGTLFIIPYSIAHIIVVLVMYIIEVQVELNTYVTNPFVYICGLYFTLDESLYMILHSASIVVLLLLSPFNFIIKYQPINKSQTRHYYSVIKSFLLFQFHFLFLIGIYIVCIPIWGLFASTTQRFDYLSNSTKEIMNGVMGSLGFSVIELPNFIMTGSVSISIILFGIFFDDGYFNIFSESNEEKNEGDKLHTTIKVIIEIIKTVVKVIGQIIINFALYISIALMFCVGLIDISVISFFFLGLSLLLVSLPKKYTLFIWPGVVLFTLLIIIIEMIVQFPIIDLSNVPTYIGLRKYCMNDVHVEIQDTLIIGLLSRYLLFFITVIQLRVNRIGFEITIGKQILLNIQFCACKLLDFWGIMICSIFLAIAACFEDINIELITYVIAFSVLVLIQTHFKFYKKIITFLLPLYAIIFTIILTIRYISQLNLGIIDTSSTSESNVVIITNFFDIFTEMNLSELGFIKYQTITEKVLGFLPNILVIITCIVETKLLISLPIYFKRNKTEKKSMLHAPHTPHHLKIFANTLMRIFSIYIPHICVLATFILATYPNSNTNTDDYTWDVLHLGVLLTTLTAFVSLKGFNIACAPLVWVCATSIIIVLIPNFSTFDAFINNIDYFNTHADSKKMVIQFNCTDILLDTSPYTINKTKYYLSNFFNVFGAPCILCIVAICSWLHANDIMAIVYILIMVLAVTLPSHRLPKAIIVAEITLTALLIFNSVCILPLSSDNGLVFFDDWEWDSSHNFRRYLLLEPVATGKSLIVIRIFDVLAIFLLNRDLFHRQNGSRTEFYTFLCPPHFPQERHDIFDKFMHFTFSRLDNFSAGLIIILAISRTDIIAYLFFIIGITVLFYGRSQVRQPLWKTLQVVCVIIVILQNVFILSSPLESYTDDERESVATITKILLQIAKTFGMTSSADWNFVMNVAITFVVFSRKALRENCSQAIKIIVKQKQERDHKRFAKTKELIDLDRNKIMLELDLEFNDKVLRRQRLNELRELRKKDKVADYQVVETVETPVSLPEKGDSTNFVVSILKWCWRVIIKLVDISIHFLHNRNLIVRLNLPLDATETQILQEVNKIENTLPEDDLVYTDSSKSSDSDISSNHSLNESSSSSSPSLSEETLTEQPQETSAETNLNEHSNTTYELIDVKDREQSPYQHASRWYMLLWGLWFYHSQQTETLLLTLFILNHLFNRSLISMFYPIVGFAVIMLCKKPYPTKKFWSVMTALSLILLLIRMFVQLPGFCITPNRYSSYDALSYTIQTIDKDMSCSGQLTNNHMSPIYLIGIYPVNNFIVSPFILDVICLFAMLLHLSTMRTRGYWKAQYIFRREWSNRILENYRRKLVNRINPNTFNELLFVVQATKQSPALLPHNYVEYIPGDLFIVENISADDSLCVRRGDVYGYVPCEDFIVYNPSKDKKNKRKTKQIKPQHKDTCDQSYFIDDASEWINDEFDVIESTTDDSLKRSVLECNAFLTRDKIAEYLEEQSLRLREAAVVESKSRWILRITRNFWNVITNFFGVVVHDQFKRGNDWYTSMFLCEVACFGFLVVFQGAFCNVEGNFIELFTGDYLPIAYVLGLLLQFVMILVDRIIYLCKSITAKLVLQYFSLIFYHVLIFFVYPSIVTTKTTSTTIALDIFYIFKIVYWVLSVQQIKSGYLVLSSKRILMRNYSYLSWLIFSTYYTIPFLYEIRTILDWTFAKTSMFYKLWLKVEDIHAELYMNQCNRAIEASRNHHYGQQRTVYEKVTGGCAMVIVMLCIVWFPLLLMSSAAPNFIQPPPSSFHASIGFVGFGSVYTQEDSTSFNLLSNDEFNELLDSGHSLRSDGSELYYTAVIPSDSMSYWLLTPNTKNNLIKALHNKDNVALSVTITATRDNSAAKNAFSYSSSVKLTNTQMELFEELFDSDVNFEIPILPKVLRMPSLSESSLTRVDDIDIPLYPHMTVDGGLSFWSFSPSSSSSLSTIKIVIASPNVPNSGVMSSLSSLGIIGLYTVVVVALYSLVRSDYVGQSHSIMFKNLPQCHGLLQLCDDIIIARQDGDLKLEEDLVNELILIYRTPSLLLEKTELRYN